MRRLLAAAYVSAALLLSPAFAVQPDEVMADPAKEARARELSRELRCMVCQNQSIDDSEAPLARDLRLLVRERIAAGDSDKEVIDFLAARYGAVVLWMQARRRATSAHAQPPLTAEETARLAQLVTGTAAADDRASKTL
jgi:cytochrome c-type biogenesis protein CcmH